MREKDFQTLFSNWVKGNKKRVIDLCGSCAVFELKISKTKSIRFDDVKEHQVTGLLGASGDGCYHKINDMPFIKGNDKYRFTNKKPFDCFLISGGLAYVVVFFYVKGQRLNSREMIFVKIEDWLAEWKIAEVEGRKSVREEYLKKIGLVVRMS